MEITKRSSRKHGVPKYPWVKDFIQNEIVEGKYPPGLRLPTETELARRLKVTPPTVSRALNELEQIGLIVRRRGSGSYVADPNKRQVLPGRKLNIGILYNVCATPSVLWNGFLGMVMQGFLHELGMDEVPPACAAVQDDEDTRIVWQSKDHNIKIQCLGEARLSHARHPTSKAVREGNFDALLTVSVVENEWLREILALNLPTVLSDYALPDDELDADVIYLDPSSGYRRATRRLIELGCKRIHFVGALMSAATPTEMMSDKEWQSKWSSRTCIDPDSYQRLNAFRSAMEDCGLSVDPHEIHFARSNPKAITELGEQLCKLPSDQIPDAVICHELDHAETLIDTFGGKGIPLKGAGATIGAMDSRAIPILADGRTMGSVAAELVTSRLIRPQRPYMRVGVKMRYRSHHHELNVAAGRPPAAEVTPTV